MKPNVIDSVAIVTLSSIALLFQRIGLKVTFGLEFIYGITFLYFVSGYVINSIILKNNIEYKLYVKIIVANAICGSLFLFCYWFFINSMNNGLILSIILSISSFIGFFSMGFVTSAAKNFIFQ